MAGFNMLQQFLAGKIRSQARVTSGSFFRSLTMAVAASRYLTEGETAQPISVFVRATPVQKTLTCNVGANGTGREVITDCAQRMGRKSNDFYLVHGSKPIRASAMLRESGVSNGATLHLSSRRRGGCFIFSISILCIIMAAIFFRCVARPSRARSRVYA